MACQVIQSPEYSEGWNYCCTHKTVHVVGALVLVQTDWFTWLSLCLFYSYLLLYLFDKQEEHTVNIYHLRGSVSSIIQKKIMDSISMLINYAEYQMIFSQLYK